MTMAKTVTNAVMKVIGGSHWGRWSGTRGGFGSLPENPRPEERGRETLGAEALSAGKPRLEGGAERRARGVVHPEVEEEPADGGDDGEGEEREALEAERRDAVDGAQEEAERVEGLVAPGAGTRTGSPGLR